MASGGGDINPGVGEDTNIQQDEYDDPMYGPHELPDEYSKLPTCCYCAANAANTMYYTLFWCCVMHCHHAADVLLMCCYIMQISCLFILFRWSTSTYHDVHCQRNRRKN